MKLYGTTDNNLSTRTTEFPTSNYYKYSLLMHDIEIESFVKFILNEQHLFASKFIAFQYTYYYEVPKKPNQYDNYLNV